MKLAYSESPSFDQGWYLYFDTRSREVKVRTLAPNSYLRASSHFEPFSKWYASSEMSAEETAILVDLVNEISVKVEQNANVVLDGTLHSLSIVNGDQFIGLEWNLRPSTNSSGIAPLIERLRSLAQTCLASRA